MLLLITSSLRSPFIFFHFFSFFFRPPPSSIFSVIPVSVPSLSSYSSPCFVHLQLPFASVISFRFFLSRQAQLLAQGLEPLTRAKRWQNAQ
jgi:hypothetical protein